jgi:hypothetical protein
VTPIVGSREPERSERNGPKISQKDEWNHHEQKRLPFEIARNKLQESAQVHVKGATGQQKPLNRLGEQGAPCFEKHSLDAKSKRRYRNRYAIDTTDPLRFLGLKKLLFLSDATQGKGARHDLLLDEPH